MDNLDISILQLSLKEYKLSAANLLILVGASVRAAEGLACWLNAVVRYAVIVSSKSPAPAVAPVACGSIVESHRSWKGKTNLGEFEAARLEDVTYKTMTQRARASPRVI